LSPLPFLLLSGKWFVSVLPGCFKSVIPHPSKRDRLK
jgi:hypothetical protein